MIRPVSKVRPTAFLNDFQVFKGECAQTMKPFGEPVMAAHEAHLMIRDDRSKSDAGEQAMYAVYQRSENRIIKIVESVRTAVVQLQPRQRESVQLPGLKAA